MRVRNVADPVYAPNSKGGGPAADAEHYPAVGWYADGDMVRSDGVTAPVLERAFEYWRIVDKG